MTIGVDVSFTGQIFPGCSVWHHASHRQTTRHPWLHNLFFAKLSSLKNDESTLYFRKGSESAGFYVEVPKRACQCSTRYGAADPCTDEIQAVCIIEKPHEIVLRETHAGVQPEHERVFVQHGLNRFWFQLVSTKVLLKTADFVFVLLSNQAPIMQYPVYNQTQTLD
ncbi:hypothetical protein DPMN_050849 [Dreissena polymorpha]|uniref:Uncharacterized protein n=1 Tax=Dreissena polymorpha TaxID=45954 RepID=A0A9D4HNE1_DREPO|nr:hypothetical protein DPMN_050849 [Dreissena polymorpha]